MRPYILILPFLAACGGDSNGPQLQPAAFAVIEGAGQVDTVGRELKDAIALRVIHIDGATTVPNYPINWTALDGGDVFAPVAYSGVDGVARQRWTLGTGAGMQRLVARALDPETGAVLVDDTITAEATPDLADSLILGAVPHVNPRALSLPLAVGDTGVVAYFYVDRWGNPGAPCADGGAPDRVVWTSSDSTVLLPLGTTVTLEAYAEWYELQGVPLPARATQVVALAAGSAELSGDASATCAPHIPVEREILVTVQ